MAKTKSIQVFIRENRAAIDAAIIKACPNIGRLNDEKRREWVLNCESLYWWAKSQLVRDI